MSESAVVLGVIGGSGLYHVDGLRNERWEKVASPFGEPSDELLFGDLDDCAVVFLPRHGRGHVQSPTSINYRANIDALKRAGVTHLLSMSACGSFREDLPPGSFVLVDQFIDRTFGREKSFFGPGLVAHVSMAEPVCGGMAEQIVKAAASAEIPVIRGGTYLVMEGPQFSTLAESRMYQSWGCDVIGMTNMPEAKLAREAEMHYATVAMVTDYDCWHDDHDAVEVTDILRVLQDNSDRARALIRALAPVMVNTPEACKQGCATCLDTAIVTAREAFDHGLAASLDAIAGRLLSEE